MGNSIMVIVKGLKDPDTSLYTGAMPHSQHIFFNYLHTTLFHVKHSMKSVACAWNFFR